MADPVQKVKDALTAALPPGYRADAVAHPGGAGIEIAVWSHPDQKVNPYRKLVSSGIAADPPALKAYAEYVASELPHRP